MHAAVYYYVSRLTREMTARRFRVVEIGSRNVNGSVRPLFEGQDYTGVDALPGNDVDVVADGATFGETGAYDLGLCLETLEHAPTAPQVVANLCRIVRPGGLVIVTMATDPRTPHSAVDGRELRPDEIRPPVSPSAPRFRGEPVVSFGDLAGEYYGNVGPGDLLDWMAACHNITLELDREKGDLRASGWVGQ
jgi:SAM-dependent methyltransferase